MNDSTYDVIIVGAGAAGLMAAITVRHQKVLPGRAPVGRHQSLNVLLLDGKPRIGAKILMSGGTRCNVTNLKVTEKDFESENIRSVRNVLNAFSSDQAVTFFKELGVGLILEEGGKFFPSTHSAKTILEALEREIDKCGVRLLTARKVKSVRFEHDVFCVEGENFSYFSKTVAICTGGLSHPTTGSDGAGYGIAKSFGHSIVYTTPALTPLRTDDPDWAELTGVSLPCRLTLWLDRKKHISFEGGFLFTHFGFSGPAALNISRYWIRLKNQHSVTLTACFLPDAEEAAVRSALVKESKSNPSKLLKRFLAEQVLPLIPAGLPESRTAPVFVGLRRLVKRRSGARSDGTARSARRKQVLPERFGLMLLKKLRIPETVNLNQLSKENRDLLVRSLFSYPLPVKDVVGYGKAEVTAGGIDFREVDSKTLESKLQPSLFFAGEILDADGRIGGFNFQWAWSSGVVAGRGILKKLAAQERLDVDLSAERKL